MAPTSTGGVATDASAAANPAAEPPRPVAVPPDAWLEDLAPIGAADWNYARAPPARSRGLRWHAGRHRAAGSHDPRGGGTLPGRLSGDREWAAHAIRAFRR